MRKRWRERILFRLVLVDSDPRDNAQMVSHCCVTPKTDGLDHAVNCSPKPPTASEEVKKHRARRVYQKTMSQDECPRPRSSPRGDPVLAPPPFPIPPA